MCCWCKYVHCGVISNQGDGTPPADRAPLGSIINIQVYLKKTNVMQVCLQVFLNERETLIT